MSRRKRGRRSVLASREQRAIRAIALWQTDVWSLRAELGRQQKVIHDLAHEKKRLEWEAKYRPAFAWSVTTLEGLVRRIRLRGGEIQFRLMDSPRSIADARYVIPEPPPWSDELPPIDDERLAFQWRCTVWSHQQRYTLMGSQELWEAHQMAFDAENAIVWNMLRAFEKNAPWLVIDCPGDESRERQNDLATA